MEHLQSAKVLIVEDDPECNKLLAHIFTREQASVHTALDGQEGLELFFNHRPDLVILDLMLPGVDGFEVCRRMRQMSNLPVIMLTARTDSNNHVRGLGAGADDYMTKPFDRKILLARAEAALRRWSNSHTGSSSSNYSDDYLTIDLARRQVLVHGQPTKLTTKEFQLLAHLLQNADRTVTFKQILEGVWGWEYQDSVDYVHVYISRLRQKLEPKPKDPTYFVTEHGTGYRFMTHNQP